MNENQKREIKKLVAQIPLSDIVKEIGSQLEEKEAIEKKLTDARLWNFAEMLIYCVQSLINDDNGKTIFNRVVRGEYFQESLKEFFPRRESNSPAMNEFLDQFLLDDSE